MKDILERIAIKGTENRRFAILEILDEYDIPYKLQEIKRERINYASKYYKRKTKSILSMQAEEESFFPGLRNDKLNNFPKVDISSLFAPEEDEESDFDEESAFDEELLYSMYPYDYLRDMELYDLLEETEESEETEDEIDDRYIIEYSYNIIVNPTIEYEKSKNKILFSAHYDVVSGSTGANDNASSISILLKMAIDFRDKKLPIQIVLFDGEETGGIGSKAYINEYINTEEKKAEVTLVNLDVCGCGDYIVIVDKIKDMENASNKLLNDYNRKKYNIIEAPSFPFSDASIFNSNGIGTLSISVFPIEDVMLLNKKEEPSENILKETIDENGEKKLSFSMKKHFGSYIWQYMHNGKYDDISYINYDMMQLTYDYIINCL